MKPDFFKTLATLVAAYVVAANADQEDRIQETFYAVCHHVEIDPVDAQNGRVEALFGPNWVTTGMSVDGCRIIPSHTQLVVAAR